MPAALVMEQVIAADGRYVDVVAAVVIVIAYRDAHAMNVDVEAAAVRGIGERAVAIVAIERGRGMPSVGNPVTAIDEQNIRASIAIGIEKRHTRAHCFRQPFFAGASRVMREVNTGAGGYVGEANRNCRSFSGLRRVLRGHHRTGAPARAV